MNFIELTDIIKQNLPEEKNINPDTRLSDDLGLCSFDMMLIIMQIDKVVSKKLDLTAFSKAKTVDDLYKIVK